MELFTPGHLIVVAVAAAVLFFGWKQLPEMSRSLGRSLRIFKTEIKGMTEDDHARGAREAQQAEAPAVEAAPARKALTSAQAAPPQAARPQAAVAPRPRPRPAPSRNHAE